MALESLGRIFGRRNRDAAEARAGEGTATRVAEPPAEPSVQKPAPGKGNRSFEPPPVALAEIDGRGDLDEARSLIRDERWVDAVDALADANRRERDPRLEIALVALRYRAAQRERSGGRPDWPPVYDDPFPEVVGRLPEIDASQLTTEALGGAVAHHGCLIVRGVFGPEQIERSVAAIERTHQYYAGEAPPEALGEDPGWYQPFQAGGYNENLRKIVANQGGTWLADSPASTAQILDELAEAGVTPAIAGHLGERPFFSLQKSTLRRSLPVNNLVAWHQDGSFFDPDIRTMNVWVALSPCGGARPSPGMEVIPRRFEEVLPVDGVMTPHSISYDLIAELAADTPTVIPEFDPGDAMIFDQKFVHRTHLAPDMTDIRYALECWFFAPSHAVSEYVPLLA